MNKYRGHKQWGWYLDDQVYWVSLLHFDEGPVKAMEIGAYDGVSANMMLDLLFPHPETRLHCLDPYLPDPTTPGENEQWKELFLQNRETGGHEEQIILHEGFSFDVLTRLYKRRQENNNASDSNRLPPNTAYSKPCINGLFLPLNSRSGECGLPLSQHEDYDSGDKGSLPPNSEYPKPGIGSPLKQHNFR